MENSVRRQPRKMVFVSGAREIGGAEVYLLNILEYLRQQSIEFVIVCPESLFSKRLNELSFETVTVELGSSFGKWRGLNILAPATFAAYVRLKRAIEPFVRSGVNVIHAQQDLKEKILCALAGRKLSVPVVWTEHGMLHPWIQSTPFSIVYRFFANRYVSKAICVSRAVERDLVSIGVNSSKLSVIHNGVPQIEALGDVERARSEFGLVSDDVVLATTSRLYLKKGIQDLLKATAMLKDDYPQVKVLVVGDGRFKSDLMRLTKDLGLDEKVVFTGFRQDATQLVSICDIFVSPTFDRTEGLPLRILEAMSLGKPVVATDVSGTKESVADGATGFLVPPRNVEALAGALQRLVPDEKLRDGMGEAGRRRYEEEFQVERMCERTLDLLTEVASAR